MSKSNTKTAQRTETKAAVKAKVAELKTAKPVLASAATKLNKAMNAKTGSDDAILEWSDVLDKELQWIGEDLDGLNQGTHWTDAKGLNYRLKKSGRKLTGNLKETVASINAAYKEEQVAAKLLWTHTRAKDSNPDRLFFMVRKASIVKLQASLPEPATPTVKEVRANIHAGVRKDFIRFAKAAKKWTNNECCTDALSKWVEDLDDVAAGIGVKPEDFEVNA